jgi:hypothetical protein
MMRFLDESDKWDAINDGPYIDGLFRKKGL